MALIVEYTGNLGPISFLPELPNGFGLKAGAAVSTGRLVVRTADDGYFDMVGDNGILVSALAMSDAAAEGDTLKLLPILPGMIFKVSRTTGSDFSAGNQGAKYGIDSSGGIDQSNTTQLLFTLFDYDNTNDFAYVTIDPTLVVGLIGVV